MSKLGKLFGGDDDDGSKEALALQRQGLKQQREAIEAQAQPKGLIANEGYNQQAEVIRRARLAAMNRKGRSSTILTQGSSAVTPAYSNTVLGA